MTFLGEIKRRKVFHVAVVYAVVAWALVEIVATVEEPLGMPGWVDTLVIVLVIVGFPLALILSWVFDMTPAGVVRTQELDSSDDGSSEAATSAGVPQEEPLANSVAVLPLDNLSPNPDDAYFAAGIHEEILTHLAKIRDLNVIARTSVMQYASAARPIAEIANELRVGAIMEGSVRYAGDRVRVTAQLIEAATGTHLWTETYDRDLEDIFAIQSDIATRIAAALKAELVPQERESIERQPTSSPEAYALYLRVMALLQEHGLGIGGSPELRSTALAFLDRALEIDPDFAAAYVERARVTIYRLNFDPGPAENYRSQRQELEGIVLGDLDKALALDPSMGAAHMALALTHQYNWRLTATTETYARALALSPNDPDVLSSYSSFSAYTGEHEKAIQLGQRAVTLDPNSAPIYNFLSLAYAVAGKLDDAIEASHRAVDLAPNSGIWNMVLSRLERARGEDTKALERVRLTEHLFQYHTNPMFLGEAACTYGQLGHREDAERAFHQLKEIAKTRRVPPATWVLAYTGLGDDDEALRWLTILADNPESYEAYYALLNIKANTYLVALFEEPRFRAVRERLGHHD